MRKAPQFFYNLVDANTRLGYKAGDVSRALLKQIPDDLRDLFHTLSTDFIRNSRKRTRGDELKENQADTDIIVDLDNAVNWLDDQGYRIYLNIDGNMEEGFVIAFSHPTQIEFLEQHGHIVLMDSSHNINHSKFKLFTVYFRTEAGTWMSGGHFFADKETTELIATGLRAIKNFAPRWKPRYFVIDQSAAEEGGINVAFRGLLTGEQNVSVIYCRVHLIRTIMRRLKHDPAAFHAMMKAMSRPTEFGCLVSHAE